MKDDSLQQVQIFRDSLKAGPSDEQSAMFIQRELRLVSHLELALSRIQEGTYGFCKSCGKLIDRGRLEAVPHTQLCFRCKSG
ncbi:MAG: TraR/DksA family transcriptional regulator [Ignavibacteriales bacterium]|nr:TraR/DksA family transcriptional regulator [Ignavibacteriales bacterium]